MKHCVVGMHGMKRGWNKICSAKTMCVQALSQCETMKNYFNDLKSMQDGGWPSLAICTIEKANALVLTFQHYFCFFLFMYWWVCLFGA